MGTQTTTDTPAEIPTTPEELAIAIGEIESIGEADFPDLFIRLEAVVGACRAADLWRQACAYADNYLASVIVDEHTEAEGGEVR